MFKFFKKIRKLISAVITIALLFTIVVILPLYVETVSSNFVISMHTDSAPKLIAHRGLSSLYPENTLPAFYGAAKYGFDAFEFDIHTTKDGEWIVIHDDDVDYMTDCEGEVEDYTLEELRAMKLVSGNHIEEHPDIVMPTLRETLDVCKEWNIPPVIEIKDCDPTLLPTLKAMLDEYELSNKAVIISFEEEYLEAYREIDKDAQILYLANEPTKEDIDWCVEHNFGINFNCWLLYKSFSAITYAKEKGITIAAWTVDVPIIADVMVLFGAEYITTNKILP